MKYERDVNKLATMVRHQRAHRPLREIAAELGDVSASTLHRLEVGKCPDLAVFLRICSWLNVEPNQFFRLGTPPHSLPNLPTSTTSQGHIVYLVRSDAALAPVTANVLVSLINAAYRIDT